MRIFLKFKNWNLNICCFMISFLIILAMIFVSMVIKNLPQIPSSINQSQNTPPTKIYSTKGHLIYTIGGHKKVKLDDICDNFVQAIVATEDHRFWKHRGIDKISLLRAIFTTMFVSQKIYGASTITQQLSKNLFFGFEKTFMRKIRELLISLQIEAQFTKKEILEAYLNQIYFSCGNYGIGRASKFFFDKPASNLTLAEASLLAGIPKSPRNYNPILYPERAKKRQLIVLNRMLQSGYITKKQLDTAYELPLYYQTNDVNTQSSNYFIDSVIKYLNEKYGSNTIYHGSLKVYTTMDIHLQKFAETCLEKGLQKLEKKVKPIPIDKIAVDSTIKLQGALVSIDVLSGAVRVMVGGRNFSETPFNRAMQNNRQPGSGFKPFLYYAAFDKGGLSPDNVVEDKKISITISGTNVWEPRNFVRHYKGRLTVKKAFVESVNTVAIQLMQRVGPEAVINTARKCGVFSILSPVYSVALGTSGVSPFEMASSFSTFASYGVYNEPHIIERIENSRGEILEEHTLISNKVLDPSICYQLVDMMQGVVDVGSGKIIRSMGLDIEIAGKTGTTNGFNDAWFTGFTPLISTSVWVGFDKYYGMQYKNGRGVTGATGAAPIWANYMTKVAKIYPTSFFKVPENINFHTVDAITGKKARLWTKNPIKVAVLKNNPRRILTGCNP